jgi:hypothetical protein
MVVAAEVVAGSVVAAAVAAAGLAVVVEAAEAAGDSHLRRGETIMKSNLSRLKLAMAVLISCLLLPGIQRTNGQTANASRGTAFATAQEAADSLIAAAEKFDEKTLEAILGPNSYDIVHTGEPVRDREMATEFAAQARIKQSLSKDSQNPNRITLNVGSDEWPFPIPIVKVGSKWYFGTKDGRQEILLRRIGRNELDAIEICRGYVEAQHEYAMLKHGESGVNQYAQRIISTPGTQDGLAWQKSDGTWDGPIGENVAKAIARGYTSRTEPYRGYFFQVLKGQGPAAPLGELDYVVKGVMIGGFALIAAPAQYRVTGVKTFIVSQDGVVYQKDLGPNTLEITKRIDRFNPDPSWTPVLEDK